MFCCFVFIEFIYNWGIENDDSFVGYYSGNDELKGFGYIGISVLDVYVVSECFVKYDVEFVKKLDDGLMKGLVFIKDFDGYWIEIFLVEGIIEIIEEYK